MTATTLTIAPSYSTNLTETPDLFRAIDGDGYKKRRAKGLNPILQSWALAYSDRTDTQRDTILAFFRATKGVDYFLWTPPGATEFQRKFLAVDWKDNITDAGRHNISVTIEETLG
jgi:phage-related protein